MKRKGLALGLAAILVFGMTACQNQQTQQAETAQEQTSQDETGQELEEVTVVLDWYPNAVHGFLYTAIEKGYYEEEGLKVTIQFPANTNDAISLTAAGKADVGLYYLQDVILTKVNENIPVKSIGAVVQEPLSIILSLAEKNITSPEDLAGKKLGYGGSVLAEAIIDTILENAGQSTETVEVIDVGFDLMSGMTTGNVDATLGCLVNHEVPAMEEQGFEVNYFFPNDYGVPDYYELVMVASEDLIESNPDKLERFLRASAKGFADMKADPDESLNIILANQNAENFPLTESVEKKSFDYLVPVMEKDDAPFLSQSAQVWQDNIDWMYEKGLIEEKPDASEMIVDLDWNS